MNDSMKKIMIIIILSFMFLFTDVKAACSYENLIQQYGQYAKESMKETGVYASLTLAQGIQEQGLKTSNSNNMFGIKMSGSKLLYGKNTFRIDSTEQTILDQAGADCRAKGGNWTKTREYDSANKVSYNAMSCFKAYSNPKDSFADHGNWLLTTFANRNNFMAATDLKGQLEALVNNPTAKYATDPNYLCSLIDLINSCDLTRFDTNPTGELSSEGCANVSINESSNEDDKLEHFTTSYTGDITQGWIYKRFEFSETFNHELPDYMAERNINDIIDIIFNRAMTSYYSIIVDGITSGPGLSSADISGFMQRIGMPYMGGEGSEFYFSNMNLSFAGGYLGQCTWYAFGRANEILNNAGSDLKWNIASNAGLWYNHNLAKGTSGFKSSNDYTQPKVGAIISWKKAGAPGHVAVVEKVDGNNVTISEANIGSIKSSSNPYGWQTTTLSLDEVNRRWGNYTFAGYIYMLD